MELRKLSETYNPIFKRKELSFFVDHISLGSPQLYDVRKSLAAQYSADEAAIYVLKLDTRTGTNRTYGEAQIYDSPEAAAKIVPKHIQARNAPTRRKKEAKPQKKK